MSTLNLTLLTDLYELTMMQGYYESNGLLRRLSLMHSTAKIRATIGYAISAGLEQVIDYINNLHFSEEDDCLI